MYSKALSLITLAVFATSALAYPFPRYSYDLAAREEFQPFARDFNDLEVREYEDILSREYDDLVSREYNEDLFERDDELFARDVDLEARLVPVGYVYPRDFDSVLYVRAPYPGRMADKFESAIDTVKRPFQKASEKITTKLRRSGNNGVYSGTPAVATSIAYSKPAGKPQIVVIPPKRN